MNRPDIDADSWESLDLLLEEALSIPVDERVGWLDSLGDKYSRLRPTLKRLLSRAAAVETGDFLERLPPLVDAGRSADDLSAGSTLGGYRLLRELGRGGMGAVWLAERVDGLIDRPVALKLPVVFGTGRGLAARMAREREILATLTHPNIARLYDAGVAEDGRPFLALEYVEGTALDLHCDQHGLDVAERLRLFEQVTSAVAYAHGRLVIHRDLKPANILVTEDGRVSLLDFGISKLLTAGEEATDGQLTQTIGRVLTPDYAAPEHIRGEPADVSGDVYALGVILYELLAKDRPYRLQVRGLAEIDRTIAETSIVKPSETAPTDHASHLRGDLDLIVLKALKYDPRERYASVESLAADLRRHRDGYPITARPDSLRYRAAKFLGRYRLPVAVAALVSLLVLATTLFALVQLREARIQRDAARLQEQRVSATNQFYGLLLEQLGSSNEPPGPLELLDRGAEMLELRYDASQPFAGHLFMDLAARYGQIGERDREVEFLRRAESIAREQGDVALLANSLCAGSANNLVTEPEAVEARLEEAKGLIAQMQGASHGPRISCLRLDAEVALRAGRADDAIRLFEEAVALTRTAPNISTHKRGVVLNQLAAVYHAQGRLPEALQAVDEIIAANEAAGLGETIGQLVILTNKGSALGGAGQVAADNAIWQDVFRRAETSGLTERLPNSFAVRHAGTLARLSRLDEALAKAQLGLDASRRDGDALSQAFAERLIGQILGRQGQVDEAFKYLDRAEDVFRKNPGKYDRALIGIDIARAGMLRRDGQTQRASAIISDVLEKLGYPARKDGPMLMGSLWIATETALDMGNATEALEFADDALSIAETNALDPLLSADVGKGKVLRGRALHALGNRSAAAREFEGAIPSLIGGLGEDNVEVAEARRLLADLTDD